MSIPGSHAKHQNLSPCSPKFVPRKTSGSSENQHPGGENGSMRFYPSQPIRSVKFSHISNGATPTAGGGHHGTKVWQNVQRYSLLASKSGQSGRSTLPAHVVQSVMARAEMATHIIWTIVLAKCTAALTTVQGMIRFRLYDFRRLVDVV